MLRILMVTASFAFLALAGGCNSPNADKDRDIDKRGLGRDAMPAFNLPGLGRGPGMMGSGIGMIQPQARGRLTLTKEHVAAYFQIQLDRRGDGRHKVGSVKDKDRNTITVDIVTLEDYPVARYEVDRHTGLMRRIN